MMDADLILVACACFLVVVTFFWATIATISWLCSANDSREKSLKEEKPDLTAWRVVSLEKAPYSDKILTLENPADKTLVRFIGYSAVFRYLPSFERCPHWVDVQLEQVLAREEFIRAGGKL